MPLCMPSIACAYKGETIVGVIFDPHRKEIFTAVKGQGARMNGEPIQVGKQSNIGDAIVAMGSPPGTYCVYSVIWFRFFFCVSISLTLCYCI
jgi:myo-inositol-1(or 4)-monophosphatase